MAGLASKPKSLLQRKENPVEKGQKQWEEAQRGGQRGEKAEKGNGKGKGGEKAFFQLSPSASCKKLKVARANYLILLFKYLLHTYIHLHSELLIVSNNQSH